MYGDFEGRQALWKAKRPVHRIETVQLSDMVQGKNGADIALVIDAMDLMGRGHLDGFCLVTSDCDFARLARYLRENGRTVWGVGNAGPKSTFRRECSHYIEVQALTATPGVANRSGPSESQTEIHGSSSRRQAQSQ